LARQAHDAERIEAEVMGTDKSKKD
jgi:hypothetical protein